tara:strand:+ start:263 stop:1081 length:819 start_codon:yes stop_codon:yes gene_type:complete
MTKLQIITQKVKQLEDQLNAIDYRYDNLRFRRKQETIRTFKKYMTPDVEDITAKRIDDRRMEFRLLSDEYASVTIERINVEDIERSSWDDTLVDFKAYSNGLSLKNVEDLKKRSELQVKLAEQFEDFKDDMIAEVNTLQEKYDGWKKSVSDSRKPITDVLRPMQSEMSELQQEALENQLLKGITLKKETSRWHGAKYPSVRVKFDHEINNVKKIKVLRFSSTKKSADLELTREWKGYEGDVINDVQTIDRVRVDNFRYDIKRNLETSFKTTK